MEKINTQLPLAVLEDLLKPQGEQPPVEETVVLGGAPARRKKGCVITKETITSRCKLNHETGCWEWTRARHKYGYGELRSGKSGVRASRVAYQLWKGEIPHGMCVCHRCDNPPCCNPEHLFLGTHADNIRDASRKERLSSKLNWEKVYKIRADPRPYRQISQEYSISESLISNVKTRTRVWIEHPCP